MADYLEKNLTEIKNWANGSHNAHNWNYYISGYFRLEGLNTAFFLKKITREFKKKLVSLVLCDVFNKHLLIDKSLKKKTFSLVTSFYCLECATHSKKQWEKSMKGVSYLVSKRGWIIMSALRDTEKYLVCGKKFPVVRIDENDVRSCLIDNGFVPDTIKIKVQKIDMWASEGFNSIIIFCAQKK